MNSSSKTKNAVRLFGMSGLQLATEVKILEKSIGQSLSTKKVKKEEDSEYFEQFDLDLRTQAGSMAKYYEVFYCLENSVRRIIRERMHEKFSNEDWWEKGVVQNVRDEVKKRMKRDLDSSFTMRSNDHLDFANFGELQGIIEGNWDAFEELFSSRDAVKKVLTSLNYLRGPIAHCSPLAEDEILRLKLTVKDWFRTSG